jgi:hypothetical protein
VIAGGLLLPARFGLFMGTVALLSALLIGVCLAKGEPASAHRR